MKKNNLFYIKFLVISQAILIILTMISLLITVDSIDNNYSETTITLTDTKTKESLQNSLDNEMIRIQNIYDNILTKETNEADVIYHIIKYSNSSDKNYIFDNVETTLNTNSIATILDVIATDVTGEVTYTNNSEEYSLGTKIISNDLVSFTINSVYYKTITISDTTFYLIINTNDFNYKVKEMIRVRIDSMDYSTNQYIWVNEVINWDGGDNYAIRYIHPNLIETEGIYLSTNTMDVYGNTPYLEELNQIKNYGTVSQTYYFKNLQDDNIVEKYEYAKLFSPFNWIVCTGMPVGDIYANNVALEEANRTAITTTITIFIIVVIILVTVNIVVFYLLQKRYIDNTSILVKEATEKDLLTGALSRNVSKTYFSAINELSSGEKEKLLFILIELDDYREINNTYGHQVSDIALTKLSTTILNAKKYEDLLFRWNDDQFLLVAKDILQKDSDKYISKILSKIREIRYMTLDEEFEVSVILGKAFLNNYGSEYNIKNTLKEADNDLYNSKNNK